MGIEQKVNQKLSSHPAAKKAVKRCYQRLSRAAFPKVLSEGEIEKISPDDSFEYFFGYYGLCPEDASGRYALCLRVNNAYKNVAPAEKAEIVLIDLEKDKSDSTRYRTLAETRTWNVQQGCMLQWLGPDYSQRVIYNDFRDGAYCSVILDVFTLEEKVIPEPVYTVSADGSFALTLDFSRLHRLRPGYGYSNLTDATAGEKCPDAPCIKRVELSSGEVTPLFIYADFASFEPRPEMQGAEHKVNHLMISPGGERFMVLHRWFCGSRKYTRLVTAGTHGGDMYNLSDDDMVSHCFWKDDETILAYENKKETGNGYYLMTDKTAGYRYIWQGMGADGHPSYSPDGKHAVTDTYPDATRIAKIYVTRADDEAGFRFKAAARVFAPFRYDNDTRCDLHPRWSRDSRSVWFDSVFEGRRALYRVAAVKDSPVPGEKPLVSCVIPTYKRSEMLTRAIDSVLAQTYGNVEVLVVDDNEPGDEFSIATRERLKIYEGESRVRLVTQERHINGAVARNEGAKSAQGKYVAFLDDDDEWLPEKLDMQVALLESGADIQGASALYCITRGEKVIRRCKEYSTDNLQFKVLDRDVAIFTSTFIALRTAFLEMGGFDPELRRHQDLQLFTDFLTNYKIGLVPEPLTVIHTDSEMNRPDSRRLIEVKKAFFDSVEPVINTYDRRSRKSIRNAHRFEIVLMALKERNIGTALGYMLRIGISPRAYREVLSRLYNRKG